MPRFIELTTTLVSRNEFRSGRLKALVNVDLIRDVIPSMGKTDYTVISFDVSTDEEHGYIQVVETYEQVKELILGRELDEIPDKIN